MLHCASLFQQRSCAWAPSVQPPSKCALCLTSHYICRYRQENTSPSSLFNKFERLAALEPAVLVVSSDEVPSSETHMSSSPATPLHSNSTTPRGTVENEAYSGVDAGVCSDGTVSKLMLVLHNLFYAFAFEIFVISTCAFARFT